MHQQQLKRRKCRRNKNKRKDASNEHKELRDCTKPSDENEIKAKRMCVYGVWCATSWTIAYHPNVCECVSECGNVNTKEIHFVVVVIIEEGKKIVSKKKMLKYTVLPCSPSFMRLYECMLFLCYWCSCSLSMWMTLLCVPLWL